MNDNNDFVEVKADYAKDMVTGFIRLDGVTIGAVANRCEKLDEEGNPVVDDAGESITINTTPYVNGVQIDPIVKVPWNTEAIPVAALKASLEAFFHGRDFSRVYDAR